MTLTTLRTFATAAMVAAVAVVAPACADDGKAAEEQAVWTLTQVTPLVERDVAQVMNGLPEGARLLGMHLGDDPGADPAELQRRIKAARENVKDLAFSKGTFFSYATPEGMVLRSEADPDRLVEKNVLEPFPALARALDPSAGVVVATGEMDAMRGVRTGIDLAFVAAHAVPAAPPPASPTDGAATAPKDAAPGPKDGAASASPTPATARPRGFLITGWSYRAYASYLEEAARRALVDEARKQEKNRTPLAYAYLARDGKVYGGPVSPEVNAEALSRLDPAAKAANGLYRGAVDIAGRKFGVAAQRVPQLGGDTTVVVIATVY